MENIDDVVMAALREQFDVNDAQLTDDKRIFSDLGADSLDIVELELEIEDRLDIEFPPGLGIVQEPTSISDNAERLTDITVGEIKEKARKAAE